MWKDFFYYSKTERRSILVLVGIGILLLVLGTWMHVSRPVVLSVVDSLAIDSFCVRDYKRRMSHDSLKWKQQQRASRKSPLLADFDPNMADSAAFCRLGLPPFMAKRIVNYRNKGGVFRKPEDFARIYGLSQAQYQQLKPYIVIDERYVAAKLGRSVFSDTAHTDSGVRIAKDGKRLNSYAMSEDSINRRFNPRMKYPEGTVLDLNAADTSQLKCVPGIGSGLAKMIVAYRNRLGGYAEVNQLQEVARIDTSVNHWFKIDSCIFRPLRINRVGLDQLRNHPYMNFYKAKVILEYRRKRGRIKGLSQLSMFQEFTEKDLQKLKPYLDFE